MQLLINFVGAIFARYFGFLVSRLGLQMAINVALVTAWLALTVSLTAAANSCLSSTGTCGGIAVNWSGLSSWVKFGFSLVPHEAITIINCLVSLHMAGFAFYYMMEMLKLKFRNIRP